MTNPSVYHCGMCDSDECPIRRSKPLEVGKAALLIEATGDREHLEKILDFAKPLLEDHPKVINVNMQFNLRTKKTPLKSGSPRRGPTIIAMGSLKGGAGGLPDDLPPEIKDFLSSFMGMFGGPEELETLDPVLEDPDPEADDEMLEDNR